MDLFTTDMQSRVPWQARHQSEAKAKKPNDIEDLAGPPIVDDRRTRTDLEWLWAGKSNGHGSAGPALDQSDTIVTTTTDPYMGYTPCIWPLSSRRLPQ